jgi:hypothetical protein
MAGVRGLFEDTERKFLGWIFLALRADPLGLTTLAANPRIPVRVQESTIASR